MGAGQAACGVARAHGHAVRRCIGGWAGGGARRGCWRCCCSGRAAGGLANSGCCDSGWRRTGLCRCRHRCRLLPQGRRIEQHGVAAHNLARTPGGVEYQIDEGLVHGPGAGQAQHHGAIAAALQLHLHAVDGGRVFHALGAEGFRRGDLGAQRFRLGCGNLRQIDFCAKRLTQCRLHGDAAQSQGRGVGCVQAAQGQGRCGQSGGFPTVHVCHLL